MPRAAAGRLVLAQAEPPENHRGSSTACGRGSAVSFAGPCARDGFTDGAGLRGSAVSSSASAAASACWSSPSPAAACTASATDVGGPASSCNPSFFCEGSWMSGPSAVAGRPAQAAAEFEALMQEMRCLQDLLAYRHAEEVAALRCEMRKLGELRKQPTEDGVSWRFSGGDTEFLRYTEKEEAEEEGEKEDFAGEAAEEKGCEDEELQSPTESHASHTRFPQPELFDDLGADESQPVEFKDSSRDSEQQTRRASRHRNSVRSSGGSVLSLVFPEGPGPLRRNLSKLDRIAGIADGSITDIEFATESTFFEEEEQERGYWQNFPVYVDSVMGVVIVLNAVVIGLSCDFHAKWEGWKFIDAAFALIFFAEVVFKNWLLGPSTYFTGREWRWRVFEVVLVALAILEVCLAFSLPDPEEADTSTLAFFRLVRLLRVTRIARVCRLQLFSDLSVLIRGSSGALVWSLLLLCLPLYSAALLFRETVGEESKQGNGAESFGTVGLSFFTLFRCIVAGDCNQGQGKPIFVQVTTNYGWGYGVLYAAIVFFMSLGLFNVIAAIFVENVVMGAKSSAQLARRQKLRNRALYAAKMVELVELVVEIGGNAPHTHTNTHCGQNRMGSWRSEMSVKEVFEKGKEMQITPELFDLLRQQHRFGEILSDLDLGDDEQFDLFDTLDADNSGCIDVEELVDGISKLRGDARRSDVVTLNFMLKANYNDLKQSQEEHFKSLNGALQAMHTDIRQNCVLQFRVLRGMLQSMSTTAKQHSVV